MKNIGIILIIAGLVMLLIRGFSYTQTEKILDLGRLEINTEEKKTVTWPLYAGGVAVIAGIALVLIGKKNK